ncbi:MAG: hypothetical protein HN790_19265 [Methylococcales bacterium]|jgi:hypothetical protein|nr:hypothetical protein [Methylococcales bacterium]
MATDFTPLFKQKYKCDFWRNDPIGAAIKVLGMEGVADEVRRPNPKKMLNVLSGMSVYWGLPPSQRAEVLNSAGEFGGKILDALQARSVDCKVNEAYAFQNMSDSALVRLIKKNQSDARVAGFISRLPGKIDIITNRLGYAADSAIAKAKIEAARRKGIKPEYVQGQAKVEGLSVSK